jgi:type II secretory pathway pseudopilin PulG
MMKRCRASSSLRRRSRAFTLAEVCVSVLIVGVMLAAAAQTLGQSSMLQFRISERTRAKQLARALMAEILQQTYVETIGTPTFGPEGGETRATYDDVDDYNGLTETSPTSKDGTSLNVPSASTWKRTVSVVWMNGSTLTVAAPQAETGVKLITVNVYHRNVLITSLVALKGNGA